MLQVSSTIGRWARLYLVNLALLYMVAFAAGLAWGALATATSSDSAVAHGWTGSPPEQVFWWAVAFIVFLVSWTAPPVLGLAMLVHGVLATALGHPRLCAYLLALLFVVILVLLTPTSKPVFVVGLATPAALAYATIARLPDRTTTRSRSFVL